MRRGAMTVRWLIERLGPDYLTVEGMDWCRPVVWTEEFIVRLASYPVFARYAAPYRHDLLPEGITGRRGTVHRARHPAGHLVGPFVEYPLPHDTPHVRVVDSTPQSEFDLWVWEGAGVFPGCFADRLRDEEPVPEGVEV